jgi:hypothetical protein
LNSLSDIQHGEGPNLEFNAVKHCKLKCRFFYARQRNRITFRITAKAMLMDAVVTMLEAKDHWPLQPQSNVEDIGEAVEAYRRPGGHRAVFKRVEAPATPGLSIENSIDSARRVTGVKDGVTPFVAKSGAREICTTIAVLVGPNAVVQDKCDDMSLTSSKSAAKAVHSP